ncbi:hypothetical protein ARMSODRAFT_1028048 [Armillaria solidipes]|uniref:DUF6533 domain-containing protein n=1 Tax=Armillaria solidipes TaxID=1076256 RepID=A0A2H3AIG2_9AGAR|nr:hypothetical protein ARMSODRAFT_1028048 [Armillaria solidipes]
MSLSSASPEVILETIKSMQISRTITYWQMSSIAFLIYDIIIMLPKEVSDFYFCTIDEILNVHETKKVEYIWKHAWTFLKMMYLFARYYGPLYIIQVFVVYNIIGLPIKVQFCQRWFWAKILLGEILFTTVINIILIMRLNAMYGKKLKVLVFLVFLVIVEFVLELYCSLVSAKKAYETTFTAPLGLPWPGCFARPNVMFTLTAWSVLSTLISVPE